MRVIYNKSLDPYFNMAAEEYLLKNCDDEVVMFWRNCPAVIIGVHQNPYFEVNLDYLQKENIPLVRRLSGGGAVFHDLGNVNYSIFSNVGKIRDFQYFTKPIIEALQKIGVDANFSGRNDIIVGDKKISGNAQAKVNDRIMHHGTLLYGGNFDVMEKALKKREIKFVGKNVSSIKKRVGNISDFMAEKLSTEEFIFYLLSYFGEYSTFTLEEIKSIEKIKQDKYLKDSWNFGDRVKFDIENEKKYDFGIVKCELSLVGGVITAISISGDFFGEREIAQLYLTIVGVLYKISEIEKAIENIDIDAFISGMTKEEFTNLLFGE